MKMLILLLALTSCATPYQPKGWRGGYWEQKLAPDMYEVGFTGNGYTKSEAVFNYTRRRAAELTKEKGYSHFIVVGERDHSDAGVYSNTMNGQNTFYVKPGGTLTIKLVNNPPRDIIAFEAESILGNK